MALPENLQRFMDEPLAVLNDGHVQLIDVMGDDMAIVDAARVSYGAGTKRVSADRHLIRFLMRHRHTTPFEMCEIKFRVRVPMDCWRQWIRHRTASVNEYSTRYSHAIDSAQQTDPQEWRSQAKSNKQGSGAFLTEFPEGTGPLDFGDWYTVNVPPEGASIGDSLSQQEAALQKLIREIYEQRLALGVAKEQARKDLPLSTYTEAYWKMDLHNLFHFLGLRMDPHAQLEIRSFANAVAEVVKVWVPWAWEAFEDYRLNGMYLTRFEVDGLKALLSWFSGPKSIVLPKMDEVQVEMFQQQVEMALSDPTYSIITTAPAQWTSALDIALKGSGFPAVPDGKKEPREVTEFKAKIRRLLPTD